MSTAAPPKLMTTEEFLALPDDGVERWLIRGQLRTKGQVRGELRTVRNRRHSRIMIIMAYLLEDWLRRQPEPRGQVLGGEVGVRLRSSPDSIVGIDLIYISADVVAAQSDATTLIDGIPILAVEILSPSDTIDDINEKIDTYVKAGVGLVWVIDAHHRTVEVFRPGAEPELVNVLQELSGDPALPGFRVPVAQLFA